MSEALADNGGSDKLPFILKASEPLAPYSTFGIGGVARYLIEADSELALKEALAWVQRQKVNWVVVGKGSNTLFDDRGFDGAVIFNRYTLFQPLNEGRFLCGSGLSFSYLGAKTARMGWSGLEFASGIPGTVGGALFMNAGANGQESQDTLVSVDFLSSEGKVIHYRKEELSFAYRFSSFQQMPGLILRATFQLQPLAQAKERQLQLFSLRKKTQPYGEKSCGCVFRNPKGCSAGQLIDACGLKGAQIGGAVVSSMHANFIVNSGQAKAKDVLDLIAWVQETVLSKKGIVLENEIRFIPYGGSKC